MEQAGGEHGARVPGRDDRVGTAFGDGDVRRDERGVGLAADGLGGLLVHLDRLGRLDERETVRVEAGRAEEGHVDPVGGSFDRACDDLGRCLVAPHRIDRDAGQGYGAGVRSGSISRPLYVWHVGQTRCGRLG